MGNIIYAQPVKAIHDLRISRRRFVGSLAAGAAVAAVGAPMARAASGDVKVLVWEGYENPDAFASLSAIDIQAAYLAANEDTITKTAAPGAFDLITIYQGMIDPLVKLNRLQSIDESRLSNLGDLYPFFRDTGDFSRGGMRYGVPYTWGTMMVLYDADKTDEPASFDDLMSPKLKGKIAMPDDAYAVITTFARYAGIEDANHLTRAQLDEVMTLLLNFKPQLLSIAPSYGELPAMMQRGEIVVSLPDWTPSMIAANDSGMNVRSTIPDEGAFSFVDCWMHIAGSANEDGAYAVMDAAIGKQAQTVMGATTGLGIVNKNAVPALGEAVSGPWSYENIDNTFARAPLYPGAPIESDGDVTTLQDWINAWTDFKAS